MCTLRDVLFSNSKLNIRQAAIYFVGAEDRGGLKYSQGVRMFLSIRPMAIICVATLHCLPAPAAGGGG